MLGVCKRNIRQGAFLSFKRHLKPESVFRGRQPQGPVCGSCPVASKDRECLVQNWLLVTKEGASVPKACAELLLPDA